MRTVALSSIAAFLLFALPAHAQIASTDPVTVDVSPQNPRPYQTITVTPASTLLDLASAKVTVSVNGKVIESGGGVQRVPVTVGGPGELTTISVSVVSAGKTYGKTVSFRPADVSLIVEPVSTVHPLYNGAMLPAPQGRVRVIALADLRSGPATRINPANLVYTWKLGDRLLSEQSGIGRNILAATAPVRYRDAVVAVTVTTSDQSVIASAATTIAPVDPLVRIYPTDPLSGPDFDHALSGSYAMSGEEEAFRGVAYFFGTVPSLAWAVNGMAASSEPDVTVRTTGTGAGTATLSLSALTNASSQTAISRLSVSFGGKKATNIFGF